MTDPRHNNNADPSAVAREEGVNAERWKEQASAQLH